MSETIHVAYCLDDGYAEPTCVSMASMLANTKFNVHFHVISNMLSNKNKARLASLKEQFKHGEWSFHSIKFDETAFILNNHLTIETYYRLFLPTILPELEKIIYIDGDTVVVGDIKELWEENLDGKIAGVVQDIPKIYEKRLEILGNKENYFNAGILLLNLKEFSKLYTLEALPKIIKSLYDKFIENNINWCADQEVLNYLLNKEEHAKFLNTKYNLLDHNVNFYSLFKSYSQGCCNLIEWIKANKNPTIIHYCSPKKPWHLKNEFILSEYWRFYYKYKALTPFYDPKDNKRIDEYNHKEKVTKTEALIPTNLYIQFFWRDIFVDSAKYVKQVIGNRKLIFWGATNHIKHIMAMFAKEGLYPYTVVDGLADNLGKSVFEYTVQPAEMLKRKADEYFVVLTMETKKARDIVINLLKEYGYNENDFVHTYAEAYKIEKSLMLRG